MAPHDTSRVPAQVVEVRKGPLNRIGVPQGPPSVFSGSLRVWVSCTSIHATIPSTSTHLNHLDQDPIGVRGKRCSSLSPEKSG